MQKVKDVLYKNLGRDWGVADYQTGVIEIHRKAKGKKQLEILIHEATHVHFDFLDEGYVAEHAADIARLLWKEGYRKIDNIDNEKMQDEL